MPTRSVHRIAGIDFGRAADRLRLADGDPQRSRHVFKSIDVSMRTTSAPWGISMAMVFSHRPQPGVAALTRDRPDENPVIHGRAGSLETLLMNRQPTGVAPGGTTHRRLYKDVRSTLRVSRCTPSSRVWNKRFQAEQASPLAEGDAYGSSRAMGCPRWVMITVRPLAACLRIAENCRLASVADMRRGMSLLSIGRRWIGDLNDWSDAPQSPDGFQSGWKVADCLIAKCEHIAFLIR